MDTRTNYQRIVDEARTYERQHRREHPPVPTNGKGTAPPPKREVNPTADPLDPEAPGAPLLVALGSVEPEVVTWLWPGWIPRGKLTILDGDPGLGKSTLLLDLAARVTKGDPLPDGGAAPLGAVVLLTAEDGLADTVRPRLDNLGADVARVHAMQGVRGERGALDAVTLPLHLPALRAAIEQTGAVLVIVDPFTAYLSEGVNSRIDHDVRRTLAPLARLAEDTGSAVVLVRHLNKTHGGPAMYRGGGSIGMIGAARAGLLVAPDPDDADTLDSPRRVLAVVKANLAERPASLRFTVEGGANGASRIVWTGTSPHRADRLVAAPEDADERGALRDCKEVLAEFLASGVPRTSREWDREYREAGFSEATARRAKRELGVRSERVGGIGGKGGWVLRRSFPPADEHLSGTPHEMGTPAKALNEHLSEPDPDHEARLAMRDGA
jgi:AAA domain-containing protein